MRVLIADDERLISSLIGDFLEEEGNKVFIINDTDSIVQSLENFQPDIVLLDLFFPDQEGIKGIEKIKNYNSDLPVAVLSSNLAPHLIKRAFQRGANGYFTKSIEKKELLLGINQIMLGNKFISREVNESLIKEIIQDENSAISLEQKLTDKEKEILELISEGLTSSDIAEKLYISEKTVETHRRNMMQKFDTNKITKLIKVAVENNII